MKLSDNDKQLIATIDEQVRQLFERNASDSSIVNTLFEFAPEVKCIVSNTEDSQLKMYLNEYKNFEYFEDFRGKCCFIK